MLLAFKMVRRILLVVVLIVAGLVAAVLSTRPDLQDSQRDVEAHWQRAEEKLDERYALLGASAQAVEGAGGAELDVAKDLKSALSKWRSIGEHPGTEVSQRIAAAAELEGLAIRLETTIGATRTLRETPGVPESLFAMSNSTPTSEVEALNGAVRHFQKLHEGFPARLIAGPLGFEPIPTLELAK